MSEFTTVGKETFPSLYADEHKIAELSTMDMGVLERMAAEYRSFLEKDDLMPRARETANRIYQHIIFEMDWRGGVFDERSTEVSS